MRHSVSILCADFSLAWYSIAFGWWRVQFYCWNSERIKCKDGGCNWWTFYPYKTRYEEGKTSILSVRLNSYSFYAFYLHVLGLTDHCGCPIWNHYVNLLVTDWLMDTFQLILYSVQIMLVPHLWVSLLVLWFSLMVHGP